MRRTRGSGPLSLSLGVSLVIQVLNAGTGILLARALGAEGRGELAAAIIWPSLLAGLGSLGLADAATFQAARRTATTAVVAGSAVTLALIQSLALVAVGFLLVPLALSGYDEEASRAAVIFLLFIPINLVALTLLGVLNGLQRFRAFNALRLLVIAGSAAGIVGLWAGDNLTVLAAAVVYLVANGLTLVGASLAVGRALDGRPRFDRSVARGLWAYGLRSHTSSVPLIMNERLDQLLISVVLAPVQLGLYVVAVTLTSITSLVGSSVAMVSLPTIARLGDGAARRELARKHISLTILGSLALTIPLVLAAGPVVDLLFGAAFSGAVVTAQVLLLAAAALSTNRVLGAIMKAVDRPLEPGKGELLGLAVTLAALAVLLPTLGIVGAGIASLLAYVVSLAWNVRGAAAALSISPRAVLLPRRLVRSAD